MQLGFLWFYSANVDKMGENQEKSGQQKTLDIVKSYPHIHTNTLVYI